MQTSLLFFVMGILSLSPCKHSGAHVYYVSASGSDAGAGTFNAPFRHIDSALARAVPGDTVFVRGGVYHEKVAFPRTGSPAGYITLKACPGEIPVIDGTGLSIRGKEALVTIRGVSYITFEGFDVCNYRSDSPRVNIDGILLDGGSGNIRVRRNRVYHIEHNVALREGRSGHGIEVSGNTAVPMHHILVEDNIIHDCRTGYSENLTINGYVDGFIIRGNTLYNCENIGIDAAGGYWANGTPAYNYARNGLITGNTLYHIESARGPLGGYGAIGIYVDGARHITVERNRIYDSDRGIGIVSENDGYPTRACIVRNNLVYDNWRTGIYLGGYLHSNTVTDSCYVVNNTLYANDKVVGYYNEMEGEIRLTENCRDNTIEDNLVFGRPGDLLVHKYTATGGGNLIDHNLYYTTGTTAWLWNKVNGDSTTTFAGWQSVSGGDAHSINGVDPQLADTVRPDLHIRGTSPVKNAGILVPAERRSASASPGAAAIHGTTDIDGHPRIVHNKISIGAQQ
jgi:hypothetical protein